MTGIIPFRGLLYDQRKVSIRDVIAPPYDIITPGMLDVLYSRSPYNISRIDCGMDAGGDDEKNNKYVRSATALNEWIKSGIMKYAESPAFYLYETTYTAEGQTRVMRGVFAAVRLVPLGEGVFPHEKTKSKPKLDRLNLIQACRANISPVFTLYDYPGFDLKSLFDRVQQSPPYFECSDDDAILHRFWIIDGLSEVALVKEAISGRDMFIADGHHRYETSLEFQRIMRESEASTYRGDQAALVEKGLATPGEKGYDYVLMLLVNVSDGGITILPTHRLLRSIPDDPIGPLKGLFKVEHVKSGLDSSANLVNSDNFANSYSSGITGAIRGKAGTFGLYLPGSDGFYTLEYTGDVPEGIFGMDVMILHEIIFKKLYNVWEFDYEMDPQKTVERVKNGDFKAAFILNPTKVGDIELSAKTGVRMPAKSTYFYPKIPTGMVLNALEPKE
ncbi:MAG: DUF1015 domain-containing protein [Nitrospirae bacterium]|nr:DUF1015 domain-containing protein [Nitrospirota bacterium]